MLITLPYMLLIGAGWIGVIFSLAEVIGMGFITRAIMKSKNREGGFAWGFFLAGIGIIVCATKRRIEYDAPSTPVNSYLSDKPLRKEAEPPKPATWKCIQCGRENSASSSFCTDCGERRHYNWVCAQCGKENALDVKFCPDCGNARTDEQEKTPRKPATDEEFLEYIRGLSCAAEIADAFEEKYGSSENDSVRAMISMLNKAKKAERSYGNMKKTALNRVEAFFSSGMEMYAVDRSKPTLLCPVCGKEQTSNRETCFSCGALFRD